MALEIAHPGVTQLPGALNQPCRARIDAAEELVVRAEQENDHVFETDSLVGDSQGVHV